VLETRQVTPVGESGSKAVTARVICTTSARLRVNVAAGTFRSDLFARLAGVEIAIPPLRRRRSDVPLLLQHFFAQAGLASTLTVSANAMESLLAYDWPMNVRELRTACQRLALAFPSGGQVKSADLAAVLPGLTPEEAHGGAVEVTGSDSPPVRDER
jgi:DNA-binding NtrC family response regulator